MASNLGVACWPLLSALLCSSYLLAASLACAHPASSQSVQTSAPVKRHDAAMIYIMVSPCQSELHHSPERAPLQVYRASAASSAS